MQKSYFLNNGKYLFAYNSIFLVLVLLFLFIILFSYMHTREQVSKDLFKWPIYSLLLIIATRIFYLIASLFVWLLISPFYLALLMAIYSCKWADSLILWSRVHNEAENVWMNGIKHLLKQLKRNIIWVLYRN